MTMSEATVPAPGEPPPEERMVDCDGLHPQFRPTPGSLEKSRTHTAERAGACTSP